MPGWYSASSAVLRATVGPQVPSRPSTPKVSPGPGSTRGVPSADRPKWPLPPTEITGLVVPRVSVARPPQPVRSSERALDASHSICWSECENRLSGISGEVPGRLRNSVLVSGPKSGPTLATAAILRALHTGASAAMDGCRPTSVPAIGTRLLRGRARAPRTVAYWL